MAEAIAANTAPAVSDWSERYMNKKTLRSARNNGIFSAGALAVVGAVDIASTPSVFTAAYVPAFASILIGQQYLRHRRHIIGMPFLREKSEEAGAVLTTQIADDFHKLYCSAHFDNEVGSMFEDMDTDSTDPRAV